MHKLCAQTVSNLFKTIGLPVYESKGGELSAYGCVYKQSNSSQFLHGLPDHFFTLNYSFCQGFFAPFHSFHNSYNIFYSLRKNFYISK